LLTGQQKSSWATPGNASNVKIANMNQTDHTHKPDSNSVLKHQTYQEDGDEIVTMPQKVES